MKPGEISINVWNTKSLISAVIFFRQRRTIQAWQYSKFSIGIAFGSGGKERNMIWLKDSFFFRGENTKILATLTNKQQQWAPRCRSTVKAFSHTHTNSYTLRLISSIFGWRKIVAYYDLLWLTHTENWKHCRICFPFAKKWELCVWQASLLWKFSLFVYLKNAQFSQLQSIPLLGHCYPKVEFESILFNSLLFVD